MKKIELEKMVKEKELELEQLKKELENTGNVILGFEPKLKEEYYCLDRDGAIYCFEKENNIFYNSIFKNNLVYPTRELAEKARDIQQAKIRVIKEIARLNDGWIPDWNNEKLKFRIFYAHDLGELIIVDAFYHKSIDNNLYLKSIELAKQLIETHREDLLLMLEVE